MPSDAGPQLLPPVRFNAQHINADKLEAGMATASRRAVVDVVNQYARLPLPRLWRGGRAAIADNMHVKLRENNLLGARFSGPTPDNS